MKIAQVFSAAQNEIIDYSVFKKRGAGANEDESLREIIRAGALASNRNTFDPLEKAIKEARRELFHENIYQHLKLIQEYPLSSQFLAMANVWQDGRKNSAYVKGAPEAIMSLCALSEKEIINIEKKIKEMASTGLRLLGVAALNEASPGLKLNELKFNFLGLIGFMDPVRPTATRALRECYQAGIKVKMITGDYSETAKSIARQIGLDNSEAVLSGQDFIDLDEKDLHKKIKASSIFARMMPEYKLKIISVLKHDGEVVAMTGDGVNDGPALKAADIGVAMGKQGTDIAREAAGIVLLDDNFSSLVSGVHEGRRIFDNLQRAVVYLVAVHIPIAALALLPIILGWPLIFFPAHIMFLELLVDPTCSLVFEAEPSSSDLMARAPRDSKKSILHFGNLTISLIQGFSILLFVFLIYFFSIYMGEDSGRVRALVFTTLVSADILMVLANRSWSDSMFKSLRKKNQFLWPIMVSALVFLIFAIYNPFMQGVFSFSPLLIVDWLEVIVFAMFPALIFELIKKMGRPWTA